MKHILIIILCLLSFAGISQNAKQDANGNYIAVSQKKAATPAKLTGKTYTDSKGVKYPVYESAKGKIFIIRTSKTGKTYNQYLKL